MVGVKIHVMRTEKEMNKQNFPGNYLIIGQQFLKLSEQAIEAINECKKYSNDTDSGNISKF